MDTPSKRRWIKAMLIEARSDLPHLPWERASKRARRNDITRQSVAMAAQ